MMFMRIILALSLAAFTVAVPTGAAGVGSVLQRGHSGFCLSQFLQSLIDLQLSLLRTRQ